MKESRFSLQAHTERIGRIIAACGSNLLCTGSHADNASDLPVFIVGMPRSGTSLVEQILDSHPQIHGAGELTDIAKIAESLSACIDSGTPYPECLGELSTELLDRIAEPHLAKLRQLNASALRITDKMPHNFLYLGLVQKLFPHARVIHVLRHPLDTCVSIFFQEFSSEHAYAYDLRHLAGYYQQYERLMQHWERALRLPMLEVRYEDLVDNQERESRRMLEFLGLPWDRQCLDFFRNKRHVATPSYDQVRQPIYASSVERWRRYDRYLEPLKTAFNIAD
jgi:hypothetical protein